MAGSSVLKRLAGETAVYGMSTIVARILNFLLVPLYTRVFTDQAAYGVVTEFMAYIAVLQVVLPLGLETGCFRYASLPDVKAQGRHGQVFGTALSTVTLFSLLLCGTGAFFYRPIAAALGYAAQPECVLFVCGILFLDAATSILFARLRYEGQALRFAVIKTIKVCCELGFNLLFFLFAPRFLASHPDALMGRLIGFTPNFNYVLCAIFLSCVICALMMLPDFLRRGAFRLNKKIWGPIMLYSLPLMIAGLPGILNDFSDRLLFRFLIADTADWRAQMGIYQAGVKLAVLINLFIQMFRYAAEPFFFKEADQKDSPQTFARVLNYFTAFTMLIFLGILLYMDIIEKLLGSGYREGVSVVPIMALAYVLLGVYFNVSVWYKLSKKTWYAILITSLGLVVTLVVNVLFMPKFGYMAAAWGHLASYSFMLLLCVWMGRRHLNVPYQWGRIGVYIGSAVGIYLVSGLFDTLPLWPKLALNTVLVGVYLAIWWILEPADGIKRRLRR